MDINVEALIATKRKEMEEVADKYNAMNAQVLDLQKIMQETFVDIKRLESEIGLLNELLLQKEKKEPKKK